MNAIAWTDPGTSGATGGTALVGFLKDRRLRLNHPIPVTVVREGGDVMVANDELEEHGVGAHFSAAVEDFVDCVAESFERLTDPAIKLSPHLERVRDRLNHYVRREYPGL